MGYQRYAWAKPRAQNVEVPIHPQLDPRHGVLTNDTRFVDRPPSWVQDTAVPSLPDEIVGGDPDPSFARGGPVFDPTQDPEHGAGTGPALTNEEAGLVREDWVLRDDGSVAATHFSHTPIDVQDYHPSDVSPPQMDLYSPETVDIQYHKGIGSPHSPHATPDRVRRIKRWIDQFIDMHWWGVEMQSRALRFGQGTPVYPADDLGNNVTPYAPNGGYLLTTADRLLAPQQQIPPRPWDEGMTVGAEAVYAPSALESWGL